jgi:hypothetical protein
MRSLMVGLMVVLTLATTASTAHADERPLPPRQARAEKIWGATLVTLGLVQAGIAAGLAIWDMKSAGCGPHDDECGGGMLSMIVALPLAVNGGLMTLIGTPLLVEGAVHESRWKKQMSFSVTPLMSQTSQGRAVTGASAGLTMKF